MGPDTGVPGLSHGHTQARTQGSWLHSSVPLVATGCGQGRRGAWYTMFIHSQGGKDPGPNHYGSPADPQDVGRVRGAWYTMFIHSQEGRGPGPIHYGSPAEPPDVGRGEGGLVPCGPLGDSQVPLGGGGARGTCRRPQ